MLSKPPRAWHKKEKRWICYGRIYLKDDGQYWKIKEADRFFYLPEFEFVWPTGLPDKKGREGYEEDLVNPMPNSGFKKLLVIRRSKKCAAFVLQQPNGFASPFFISDLDKMEIVGNTLQHPELLENKE